MLSVQVLYLWIGERIFLKSLFLGLQIPEFVL